jgi:hypothetical protein
VFGPILESFRLPPTVPQALHGSGVDGARVGSLGGCLVRSLLGGDVFLCGLLICFWCILGGEAVDAQEGSGGDYLVGPAGLGGQIFLNGGLS